MDNEPRTLKDWRELRGLTVEELADAIGQEPERVERWEAIGWDWEPYTSSGDAEKQDVLGSLVDVLDITGGIVGVHAPPSPQPGRYVVDPTKLPEHVLRFLNEHAEEIDLRMTLPSRWGPYLKEHEHLVPANLKALEAHHAREVEHNRRIGNMFANLVARMSEHGAKDADKIGDVFEERDGKLVPRRRPEDQE
ncbi:MAG: helix-turn-helix transcriptional regulator [Actinomycetota bacterium]|nr:helix-turn-helix transcriptional regulator [Actinomycetota bacterium]